MTKRLITLLAALLVLGFVVAGCGDDEDGGNGGGGTTAAETVTDTDTDTDTVTDDETVTDDVTGTDTVTDTDTVEDETETAEGGGAAAPTSRAQAVKNCEKGVNAAEQLSADAKDKLTDLCENAASGDPDDVREAARKVCETIIEDTFPDDSPGREQALESCKTGGR